MLAGALGLASAAVPGEEVLATARQVRSASSVAMSEQRPVKLRAVVTFHEPATGITFVQDGSAGVAVAAGVPSQLPAGLRVGTQVELEGVVAQGSYAPVVAGRDGQAPVARILGAAALPEPLRVSIGELLGGASDGCWVELRGTVRAVGVRPFSPEGEEVPAGENSERGRPRTVRLSIELGTEAGRYMLILPWQQGEPVPGGLLDSRVRVRGVLGSIVNRWRQWVGLLLYVPSLEELTVERAPTADPFALPVLRADQIMQFSTGTPGEDRVRVRGVATLVQPGYRLYLRSEGGPLEVQSPWPLEGVEPGVEVDVVGYPFLGAKRALLQDSRVRVLGRRARPEPLALSRSEIMGRYADSELVRLTGRVFQNGLRGSTRVIVLEAQGQMLEAKFASSLSGRDDARVGEIRPGAEVAMTGIAQVSGAADWGGGVRPYAVNLLMRGPADLIVLHEPPWWTPARLLAAVGALILLVAVSFGWVVLLRRQVAAQTKVIHEQALRVAHERERRRIAQDIHDDLGSRLTQLALLGARVTTAAGADEPTRALGGRIAETARTTVQTMDEIVWAVNPGNDTLQSLGDYLCKVATALLSGAEIACQLDVPAVLPERRLSADHRHNLVLAVREALHNVVKHSRATAASLSLRADGQEIGIEVSDNGVGIPAQGAGRGNGLGNLQRRLAEVGGRCEIGPGAGGGTRVRLTSPLPAA